MAAFDLLDLPGVSRFLRWQHARSALQLPLLLVAALMVWDGFTGPQLAPKNLATTLTWVHYRGLVVLCLLLAGNLFCMACPFMLVRNLARRLHRPARMWPSRLRGKWLAAGLFALLLLAYELFDLWAAPRWTAMLILGYFVAATVVDGLYRGAAFCKYLCPLGQFNMISALISPLEVQAREPQVCTDCRTKDCIKGRPLARPDPHPFAGSAPHALSGCELWLFQPQKVGNMDCTFCLDCLHACPNDNVGISARLPASELWVDPVRSGIGRFSRRPDLAVLIALFAVGGLLNAFAMVSPVYALETWLANLLGTESEIVVLSVLFLFGLLILPAALLGGAAWWCRASAGPPNDAPGRWFVRLVYALVPLGFAVWLAHYAFHFLTGFWTFVPVVQSLVADVIGWPLLGSPRWGLGPVVPAAWLYPLELGILGLGWFGSLIVAWRRAAVYRPERPFPVFLPWATLISLLAAFALWLMAQPMEMRGTFWVG